MKRNMKRVLLGLFMMTCLFSLSACGQKKSMIEADPTMISYIEQTGPGLLQEFAALPDSDIDMIAQQKAKSTSESDIVLAAALESWKTTKEELGELVSVGEVTSEKTEEGYKAEVHAVFENRSLIFTLGQNEDLSEITFISFNPVYSTGEKLKQAGLNTLLGMGTVFIILIFISLIIGCFKYINQFETNIKNRSKKDETVLPELANVPVLPDTEPEDLADDLELAAVITAAIAASEGTTPNGLVVRSIRRAPVSGWKKA